MTMVKENLYPESLSIHPRNWTVHVKDGSGRKKNTCQPANDADKGKLGKHRRFLSRRRTDHSNLLRDLKSGQNPMGYKAPGSMKGR